MAREELTAERETWCPECYHTYPRFPATHRRAGEVISYSCKRRTCPAYAPMYLRDRGDCLMAGLAEWTRACNMVTLTAPGRDRFPFKPSLCRVRVRHRCSGSIGCRVEPWDAARWNGDVLKNWTALRNECQQVVRRAGLPVPVVLAFVLEVHKRGLYHLHVLLGWEPTAAARAGHDLFVSELAARCERHDFGPNFDPGKPLRFVASDAGKYAAKYVRPQEAKGGFVPALVMVESLTPRDPVTGRLASVVRPVFVNPLLTRRSGVTMTFLRWCRYAFVVWGRRPLPDRAWMIAVYRIWVAFPGSELEELDPVRGPPVAEGMPF